MAKQVQLLRGTTAQNDIFTGEEGALTYDTDKKQLRIHDGATVGGASFVDSVIEFQAPTSENDYTWYRKYTSGWVEQGGVSYVTALGQQVNLPVTMENGTYTLTLGNSDSSGDPSIVSCAYRSKDVDKFVVDCGFNTTFYPTYVNWEVKGMAAHA